MTPSRDIAVLLEIMRRLRAPDGCPWDREQTFETIVPYTIEEAYEVADAIERRDTADLVEELGDLLLQVVFHAQMATELGLFEFGDVVEAITRKMVRRHPHVFGERREQDAHAGKGRWEAIKAEEKAQRAAERNRSGPASVLDGVPRTLPALLRALALQKKAGAVGFDWNDARQVLRKMLEEIGEIEEALESDPNAVADEIGDLLFAVVNLARHLGVDPEAALRGTNTKFERRFRGVEAGLAARGRTPEDSTLEEMDRLWEEAKEEER